MNKILLGIAILAVVIGGAFYLTNRASAPYKIESIIPVDQTSSSVAPVVVENNTAPTASEISVNYTDTGYAPNATTVKAGTKVTFVNHSSGLMWTASAVHPTHLELPGFDALKGFAQGKSYSYTFDKVGTWRYHDHLKPKYVGTVTVE